MDIQRYTDELFSDYEDTPELNDFKEELTGHIDGRIKSLMNKNMSEKEAFEKAVRELGDVSTIADDIGKKKRQEVFSEMYMNTRSYISTKRSALYALFGLFLCAAILIPLITWFASGIQVGAVATFLPFSMVGILGFVFLGLTQETASREPMSWKRALWYVLAAGLVLFGALSALITYYGVQFASIAELTAHGATAFNASMLSAVSILMIFGLPGIALGIFLILTEKDRSKPWVAKMKAEAATRDMERFGSPAQMEKFGFICGALWIAAIAGFILLTITVGFKFSWLAIAVALIVQLIIMAVFTKSK